MKLTILLSLISLSALASETTSVRFGDTVVSFVQRENVWVNESCETSCQALIHGKAEKKSISPTDLIGGKNPASVRCTKVFKGSVVIGTSTTGDQQSFCSFPDGSYLKN